ncbi:hypothetical protein AVEN_23507-1 [Araneus ventricosus]|uniref:Uncharacterized protein n=1 Tax=Araneus ventricosus TaxID=182803 RepID=A0A4Y1ZT16_ARAVE|nr:hypothetical protein AVEN_23507-1 [Araneus ventricosus]
MVSHPNETLANFLLSENIEWKFIPPKSPNFGGFISGADSLQDALEISTQAVSIMDQASMVLRKWTTNSDELRQLRIREGLENQLQDNPASPRANSTKVLGMLWNTVEDYLIVVTQSLVDSL